MTRISEIWRYPVKSMRGERLDTAAVEPWGLAGDRRWMVVDENGSAITSRERPNLILTVPTLSAESLTLDHPRAGRVSVPVAPGELVSVDVWRNELKATHAREADAFVSEITGQTARLVYLDDPTRRRPNPDRSTDRDRVSLADGYPLLLVSEASMNGLNDWIAEGPRSDEGPLSARRFRPNLVVADSDPWDEDRWRTLTVGGVPFRAVEACDRCVLTTVDPDTAGKGKEPITSLARHRRWDGKTWFGVNLIPDAEGTIEQDDAVTVLTSVESYEPQR